MPPNRATLRLTLSCNNRCVFCAQEGLQPARDQPTPHREVCHELEALRQAACEVTFVGGEPTLYPELEAVVACARDLGFSGVGLQSNGRLLARAGLARTLASAGATDVHLSVHGAGSAVHDYHTGVAGSFDALLEGMAACRAAGMKVVATTLLTRSSFRSLADLPWLLQSRGASAWSIAVPRLRGRAARAPGLHRVVPRLGMALPYALHALESARRLGLPAWIQGAPLCGLGPLAARSLPAPAAAFAQGCEPCAARDRCPGLDPAYLRRFGADELAALSAAPPREQPRADISCLFVGAGELGASPDLDALPRAPGDAVAGLHSLAKARPGAAERGKRR